MKTPVPCDANSGRPLAECSFERETSTVQRLTQSLRRTVIAGAATTLSLSTIIYIFAIPLDPVTLTLA